MNQPPQRARGFDEIYCPNCGEPVNRYAVICVKCGVPVHRMNYYPKDKTVAILLAVFLSFWTWVYTYSVDAWKFWLNLVLCLFTCGIWGIVAWIWAIIDVGVKPLDFYERYPYV